MAEKDLPPLEDRLRDDLRLVSSMIETLPTFRRRLEQLEEDLGECIELARIPTLTKRVPPRR